MRPLTLLVTTMACWAAVGGAEEVSRPDSKGQNTLESLKADVESLRAPKVAWREIQWKSCLLDGLAESRRAGKPALLWIFIDRPADDARC